MKKRKVLIAVLSVTLIAVLAIGTTMALLKAKTDTVVNTFTSEKEIKISLREPKWDGYGFDEDTTTIVSAEQPAGGVTKIDDVNYSKRTSGAKDKNHTDGKFYGINIASQYLPGETIPKNPIVKNTSIDEPVYVAVTVECFRGKDDNAVSIPYGNESTDETFCKDFGVFSPNDSNWKEVETIGNKRVFVYVNGNALYSLNVGEITGVPVFNEVVLNETIGEDESGVEATTLPEFKIQINAYAIQARNINEKQEEKLIDFVEKVNGITN